MTPTLLPILFALLLPAFEDKEERPFITLASTTSTDNSGLLDHLLPMFTEESGVDVRVIARGTGQAIRMAERGDCDILLVHHRPSEDAFIKSGFGVKRHEVMYNDFIIVGPSDDPAKIDGMVDATKAFDKIREATAMFASRGDDSGTHKRERSLWQRTEKGDPSEARLAWFRSTGSGMGATLNVANQLGAYVLTDRGTWLSFNNRAHLKLLVEGDPQIHNPYGMILVHPKRHPHVKAKEGQALIDWFESDRGRTAIADFRVAGQVLFHPSQRPAAKNPEPSKSVEFESSSSGDQR